MAWCFLFSPRSSQGFRGHGRECWAFQALAQRESITVWHIDCWVGAEDCLQGSFPKSSLILYPLASCWPLRGWTGGMGDCKPTSFVLESWEEASLTLSLQRKTLGPEPSVLRVALILSSGNECFFFFLNAQLKSYTPLITCCIRL